MTPVADQACPTQTLINQITKKPLTRTHLAVLDAFIDADGRISRADLIDRVYPDPDCAPYDESRTICVHICNIRKRLNPPVKIKSIFGFGYALHGVPGMNAGNRLPTTTEPTSSERTVLRFLMDRRWHTVEAIIFNLYQLRTMPKMAKRNIYLFVMRLRRKLAKGFMIENDRGKGYRLIEVDP